MRIQIKGETIDEAINNAMLELSTTSDNIAYEVVQEGSEGFFGIGSRPFIIEAYKNDDKEENYKKESVNKKEKLVEKESGVYEFKTEKVSTSKGVAKKEEVMTRDPEEVFNEVKNFLEPIFKEFNTKINLDYKAIKEKNTLVINISGEKIGVIIGKHGATLDALQHLANIVVNNGKSNRVKISMDSENYREKRNKTLETLAKTVANNVRKTHKDYELEPMSSYERRIIHSVLQKEKNIETVSKGVDKDRHVVVKYKR
ncbi:MAG: Jag N-terminal domain-containing protein [Lachnospiraceae bacterium]|nr:Jag N-terminal domain-containing protein [Lachnospiraceae bacterium]